MFVNALMIVKGTFRLQFQPGVFSRQEWLLELLYDEDFVIIFFRMAVSLSNLYIRLANKPQSALRLVLCVIKKKKTALMPESKECESLNTSCYVSTVWLLQAGSLGVCETLYRCTLKPFVPTQHHLVTASLTVIADHLWLWRDHLLMASFHRIVQPCHKGSVYLKLGRF